MFWRNRHRKEKIVNFVEINFHLQHRDMTQDILDEVFDKIKGLTFRAINVDFYGDFRLEVGDIVTVNTNNESCIDNLDFMMKVEDGKIKDIRFDGEACAICTSSTSIMINLLLNKNIREANEIISNFKNMIEEKEYNEKILKEAIVYSDIAKQPNRKKCALLTWQGIKTLLEEELNNHDGR